MATPIVQEHTAVTRAVTVSINGCDRVTSSLLLKATNAAGSGNRRCVTYSVHAVAV